MILLRLHPKIGLVYTGGLRRLAKVSNDILMGLTDQGKTSETKNHESIVPLKRIILYMKKRLWNNVRAVLNF